MFAEHATPCQRNQHRHFYLFVFIGVRICEHYSFFWPSFSILFVRIYHQLNGFPLSTSVVFIFVQFYVQSHISSFLVCHRNQKLKRINMPLFACHTHTTSTFLHCSFSCCCFTCFVGSCSISYEIN